jgi:hypothetical protein
MQNRRSAKRKSEEAQDLPDGSISINQASGNPSSLPHNGSRISCRPP